MQTMQVSAHVGSDGRLRLDVPTRLPEGEHEIVIVAPDSRPRTGEILGTLAGTLSWRGDAVAEQRRLRDEW